MDKLVAALFYIGLGFIAIGLTWYFESDHTAVPPAQSTEVKSDTINLKPSDFDGESQRVQDAINNLGKPVQKPTTDQTGEQLQPATKQ